jgi:methionine aminopeptidase
MPIVLKSKEEIALMREAGRAVGQVLEILKREIKPGIVSKKLDGE